MMPLFHKGRGKAGKALAVTGQLLGPVQINMAFVGSQTARLVHILAQKRQGGIAMQVKYRKFHVNASSK